MTDEEWERDQTPVYHSSLARVGGTLMIGTYLFLAVTIAASGYVLRKLWSHDRDTRNWRAGE